MHQALNDTIQSEGALPAPYINIDQKFKVQPAGALPQEELGAFWQAQAGEVLGNLYERLAFDVVQVITVQGRIIAMLICEDWNFTSTLKAVLCAADVTLPIEVFLEAFQQTASERQSEFLILSDLIQKLWANSSALDEFGYQRQAAPSITFPAWQQAVQRQSGSAEQQLWVKTIARKIET